MGPLYEYVPHCKCVQTCCFVSLRHFLANFENSSRSNVMLIQEILLSNRAKNQIFIYGQNMSQQQARKCRRRILLCKNDFNWVQSISPGLGQS